MTARKGKIARLPHALRHEINQRIRDGQVRTEIVAWLNAKPEVQDVLRAHFEGQPINSQNMTDWERGGYQDWLMEVSQYEEARRTSEHAQYICAAMGLDPSDALAVVFTGHLVKLLGGQSTPEEIGKLGPLFNAITNAKRANLDERKIAQGERALSLAEKKFQHQTVAEFLKWRENQKVNEVADDSGLNADQKTEILGKIMFGEDW